MRVAFAVIIVFIEIQLGEHPAGKFPMVPSVASGFDQSCPFLPGDVTINRSTPINHEDTWN